MINLARWLSFGAATFTAGYLTAVLIGLVPRPQPWIVGQAKTEDGTRWELGGVFSSKEKARAVCTEPTDCMWPVPLDEFLGRHTTEVGVYPAQPSGPQ